MTFDYQPGDLVAIDNRPMLHGCRAFDQSDGRRWLQGCFVGRDELLSRLRIPARGRRERAG